MTTSHPADPQLGEISKYDREAVIAAVTDFYHFLAQLPYIEPADILHPPLEGGWPNITTENFACLGKSDEVIALLKCLPYIRMDGHHEYVVAPETFPCDYRRDYFQTPSFAEGRTAPWDVPVGLKFPSWVIPLTYGKNHGDYLMFDTTDGTAIVYQITGGGWSPAYEAGDPRSWRNECEGRSQALSDILGEWKKKYESLTWIGFPASGWPNVWTESNYKVKDIKEMQEIIRSHGWPNEFKRNECKHALAEWEGEFRNRRQAELQTEHEG
ncbi:hypothetical protein MMC22_009587 [Lobaria immixta]|nr:hypothetical protein [Lobaria immixta]